MSEEWRCFHCDQSFTDSEKAALHFGTREHHQPACTINIAEYRRAEAENQRYREEDSDLHREMYGLRAQHLVELRRAEEAGYARGLKDGAAQALSVDSLR